MFDRAQFRNSQDQIISFCILLLNGMATHVSPGGFKIVSLYFSSTIIVARVITNTTYCTRSYRVSVKNNFNRAVAKPSTCIFVH